jgi:hypothetical protein
MGQGAPQPAKHVESRQIENPIPKITKRKKYLRDIVMGKIVFLVKQKGPLLKSIKRGPFDFHMNAPCGQKLLGFCLKTALFRNLCVP